VEQCAWLESLRERGVAVDYRAVDLVDRGVLAKVIAEHAPALRGVFHCAGSHDDRLLENQGWPELEAGLAGKLLGACHMHALTAHLALDHFVLFSSAMALLPAPGLASYVAGNAGLDALAHARRAQGLAALSVNWGPWQHVGMARQEAAAQWRRHGLQPMAAESCLAALGALLGGSEVQVAVASLDEVAPAPTVPPSAAGAISLSKKLLRLPERRRRAALADYLAETVASVLHLGGADEIERGKGFFALGLDSVTTLDLRNRIQAALRCRLEHSVLFRHSSVDSLAEYLASELAKHSSLEAVR
jgi:acyl carrier protein